MVIDRNKFRDVMKRIPAFYGRCICIEEEWADAYCCLVTRNILKDCGEFVAMWTGPRDGRGSMTSQAFWVYVPRGIWEWYVKEIVDGGMVDV